MSVTPQEFFRCPGKVGDDVVLLSLRTDVAQRCRAAEEPFDRLKDRTNSCGAPRQIRTAAPAFGELKVRLEWCQSLATSALFKSFRVIVGRIESDGFPRSVAILLPRQNYGAPPSCCRNEPCAGQERA